MEASSCLSSHTHEYSDPYSQVSGVVRFRNKVHSLANSASFSDEMDEETTRMLHKTMKKVSEDVDAMAFNTAISALMVFTNHLSKLEVGLGNIRTFVIFYGFSLNLSPTT